ncbi:MAG TPA: hypothetical protein VKO35_05715 [Acidimicrobiia bacterium]|nr:hypothetical protein [Acidimicrobiia bacterium]
MCPEQPLVAYRGPSKNLLYGHKADDMLWHCASDPVGGPSTASVAGRGKNPILVLESLAERMATGSATP